MSIENEAPAIINVKMSGKHDEFLHVIADFPWQDQSIRYIFVYYYQAGEWAYSKARGFEQAARAVFDEVLHHRDEFKDIEPMLANRSNTLKFV